MCQIGKYTKVYYDNSGGTPQDLSAHVMEASGIPLTYDEVECSGFGQDKGYLNGQADSTVTMTLKFNSTTVGLFLASATGSIGSNTARTLTFQYGNNAAATTGDPEIEGEFICTQATPQADKAGLQSIAVQLRPNGGTAPAWGTVS